MAGANRVARGGWGLRRGWGFGVPGGRGARGGRGWTWALIVPSGRPSASAVSATLRPVDVPQHDRGADGGREPQERLGELALGLASIGRSVRAARSSTGEVEAGVEHRLELVGRLAIVERGAGDSGRGSRRSRRATA